MTVLRVYTVVFLVLYAPVEIWYSLPAFWDPFFLVDVVGMLLLVWGVRSLGRGHGHRGPAILSVAYGWTGANFWRAAADRLEMVRGGVRLEFGIAEICFTGCILAGAVLGIVLSLHAASRPQAGFERAPEARL